MGLRCLHVVPYSMGASRTMRVRPRALPNTYEPRILPRYFENYIETICEYESNQRACVENMFVPDMSRQQVIVEKYDEMIHAFPMEDAPSLRSTVLKVLVQGDERLLEKLTNMLGFYAQSVAMLTDAVREMKK